MQGFFKYGDRFVRQLSGCAMGGVLSSDIAGIVMVDLLNWVGTHPHCGLRLIRRYVDDLFLIMPADQVDGALNVFNSYHHSLRFTCEKESGGKLPFLDLLVIRDEAGVLSTDWYRKPSASDRCMDFRSAHAYSMKVSCAKELIGRALRLSSPQYHNENRNRVSGMLLSNGYPRSLVTRLVSGWTPAPTILDQGGGSNAVVPRQPVINPRTCFRGLTYVEGISPRLRVLLEEELPSVKVVFKYAHKVSQLHTPLKSTDPLSLRSCIIYKVPCSDCTLQYVGHTQSYIKVRMSQHRADCQNRANRGTALSHHAWDEGHAFDFGSVSVLDKEKSKARRLFKEKLHIQLTENTCNLRTDVAGISTVYAGILEAFKCQR